MDVSKDQRGPLFAGQNAVKKRMIVNRFLLIIGIIFVIIIVSLIVYFLGFSYTEQVISKS